MDNLKKSKTNLKPKIRSNSLDAKKRLCEKNALNIVIELIDGGLEDDILNKLSSINVCHYEDVVEERFILKKCGYVFCNQQLTCIPAQQYKIIQNKVYDITERKKFCSNNCYKSSNYLKSQLLTSPLWMRDTEKIPKFKLLKTVLINSSESVFKSNIEPDSSSHNGKEMNFNSNDKLQNKLSELKI